MTERWKQVAGFPLYEISDAGRVFSRASNKPRILKPDVGHRGHLRVTLYEGGASEKRLVHRLVLEAFVGPAPSAAHEGAHGDGVPSRNDLSNLRWATPVENAADRVLHGTALLGEAVATAKLTTDAAKHVVEAFARGASAESLAARYGVSLSTVYRVLSGRRWHDVSGAVRKPSRRPLDPNVLSAAADACAKGLSENAAARRFGVKRTTLRRFRGSEVRAHG